MKTILLMVVLGLVVAKDPVRVPGNLDVEGLLNASLVNLPGETTLACASAELGVIGAESVVTSYVNADTVVVSKILAKESDVVFSGKVNITGSVSYSSKIQIAMKKGKVGQTVLLQEVVREWKEFDVLFINDKATVTLPTHKYLQVVANCHCELGQALLKVNNRIEWMQSCTGTLHIDSVIENSSTTAQVEFLGCSEIGPMWVNIK